MKEYCDYYNIEAYDNLLSEKKVSAIFGITLLLMITFVILASTINRWFIIGAGILLLFLFIAVCICEANAVNRLVLVQKYGKIYLYPDTKKQIVIPLQDIKRIRWRLLIVFRRGGPGDICGKIKIYTNTKKYVIKVLDAKKVADRLKYNLNVYKKKHPDSISCRNKK